MLVGNLVLMPRRADHELAWDHARALVNQLVEGVLAVCSGLAPYHGAGMDRKVGAIHGNALAVALHFQLLKIGWKTRQPLLVRQNRPRRVSETLVVPNPGKRKHDRHVLQGWRSLEVQVHGMAA